MDICKVRIEMLCVYYDDVITAYHSVINTARQITTMDTCTKTKLMHTLTPPPGLKMHVLFSMAHALLSPGGGSNSGEQLHIIVIQPYLSSDPPIVLLY